MKIGGHVVTVPFGGTLSQILRHGSLQMDLSNKPGKLQSCGYDS